MEENKPEQPDSVPLLLDPDRLKPLPKDLWDVGCAHCAKPQAKWAFKPSAPEPEPNEHGEITGPAKIHREEDPYTLCSLCFLYESEWGKRRRDQIDIKAAEIEVEMTNRVLEDAARTGSMSPEQFQSFKVTFARDEQGRLSDPKDANRILGAIAIASRIFVSKMETAEVLQQRQEELASKLIMPAGSQFGPKRTR